MKARQLLDSFCVRYQHILPHDFIIFLIFKVQGLVSEKSKLESLDSSDRILEKLFDVMIEEDYSDEKAIAVAQMIQAETKAERQNVRMLLGQVSKHLHDSTLAFKLFIVELHNKIDEDLTVALVYEKSIVGMLQKQSHKKSFDKAKLNTIKTIIEQHAQDPS